MPFEGDCAHAGIQANVARAALAVADPRKSARRPRRQVIDVPLKQSKAIQSNTQELRPSGVCSDRQLGREGPLVVRRRIARPACCRRQGSDTHAIRRQVEDSGRHPTSRPKPPGAGKACFSPVAYRGRNATERMLCRLKEFRRIATRYDRLAANYFAAVCLAATVSYLL